MVIIVAGNVFFKSGCCRIHKRQLIWASYILDVYIFIDVHGMNYAHGMNGIIDVDFISLVVLLLVHIRQFSKEKK